MTNEKFLAMSSDGKSEYCCSVVRLGELIPVEGSDFLAKTDVMGTQIVVRKDMMKEGDIMFYAANETALNEKFLSVNNLFEIGCRDMNANAEEVKAIMAEYELKYKNEADKLRAESKNVKGCIEGTKKSVTKLKKKIEKLNAKKENEEDPGVQADIQEEINGIITKIDELSKRVLEQTVSYTNLKSNIEKLVNEGKPIVDKAKELCGFFNKYGRVRCITLKGCPSFGFLFSVESMAAYNKGILDVNLEDYINQDFDTVDGELFVKAYVPPTQPANVRKSRGEKKNKKLSRFDRMIAGEFYFHYDTTPLQKNMHFIKPESILTISNKIHGCVERGTIINTAEYGDLTIGEIVDKKLTCHIKAFDTESNDIIYVPIDYFYCVPNDGEWYEIELENGKKLTITGNNPIYLPDLKVYRRVDELNGNEKILFSL